MDCQASPTPPSLIVRLRIPYPEMTRSSCRLLHHSFDEWILICSFPFPRASILVILLEPTTTLAVFFFSFLGAHAGAFDFNRLLLFLSFPFLIYWGFHFFFMSEF